MQRLLNHARWDADEVRDDLRGYVVEHLGDPGAVLVVDETGFLKKGTKSAGVQRQYSGTAGRIENCQVGVFLAYASRHGHALIDLELYLPESWTDDQRAAGGCHPDAVGFCTKPQLARGMLERALEAEIPVAWVTGDEVYGGDGRLRRWLEERDVPHVLAVKRSEALWSMGLRQERAGKLAGQVPARPGGNSARGWGRGPRVYAWARVPIRPLREPGRGHWLLVRRRLVDGELAFYVCWGRHGRPWPSWSRWRGRAGWWNAASSRPRARPGLTTTRSAATTPGIGTSPWRCWPTPSLRSCAPPPSSRSPWRTQGAAERAEVAELLPLTVAEIRRLLAALVWHLASDPHAVLTWSHGGAAIKHELAAATGGNANDSEKCGCSTRRRFAPLGGSVVVSGHDDPAEDLVPDELWQMVAPLLPAPLALVWRPTANGSGSQLFRRDRLHGPHLDPLAAPASPGTWLWLAGDGMAPVE